MKRLILLDISLKSFDGEGGVPTSGEGGVATTTAAEQPVIYGKQSEGDGQSHSTADANPDPAMEFDSLIKGQYKDQFDSRIQQIIDRRFKSTKETETKLSELSPIAELLQEKYGVKDVKELKSVLEGEVLEELAYKNGMDVDTYREFRENKMKAQLYEEHVNNQDWQEQVNQKVAGWYQQAESMKETYPDFDFQTYANENEEFIKLLNSGLNVKMAYEVLNIDNLKANAAKQAQENTLKTIKANGNRPREAAASNGNSPIVKADVRNLDRRDRAEIAKRAAAGEKIEF